MARITRGMAIGLCLALLAGLWGCVSINFPPVAEFVAAPTAGTVPLTVTFDATASSDIDGHIQAYHWDFGDGTFGSGVTVSHTYSVAGTYVPQLVVTDNGGLSSTAAGTIVVNAAQVEILEWTLRDDLFRTTVDGTARNGSGRRLASAEIIVVFRDADGDEIDRGSHTRYTIDVGETWSFTVSSYVIGGGVESASVFVGDVEPEN